jgi:hypothetical protein
MWVIRVDRDLIKKNVFELLKNDERTRNDDRWLIYRYIRDIQKINIFIPFEDFKRMIPFESVSRCRRHIQNNDKVFLPTDQKVREHRQISEEDWLAWVRKNK